MESVPVELADGASMVVAELLDSLTLRPAWFTANHLRFMIVPIIDWTAAVMGRIIDATPTYLTVV